MFLKSTCAVVKYHHAKTYLSVPLGRKDRHVVIYIRKLLVITGRIEWMKGICHIWSRGRHFSPSLPGDRYLNLGSKSDLRAEISGSIVWYDALAPRPEVLFSFSTFYANNVANFATFQNRLIFLILSGVLSRFARKISLMCVYGHCLY